MGADWSQWALDIMLVVGVFSLITVLCFLVAAMDFCWATEMETEAVVVKKEFLPARVQEGHYSQGRKRIPLNEIFPNRWHVTVRIGEECGVIEVDDNTGQSLMDGQTVLVNYRIGRFSGGLYVGGPVNDLPAVVDSGARGGVI